MIHESSIILGGAGGGILVKSFMRIQMAYKENLIKIAKDKKKKKT